MKQKRITSHSHKETVVLGKQVAGQLKPGQIVCLFGNLGSGKTTFVKGLASGLKISPLKVNSPTFVFMNMYDGKIPLYHFDLYRIENEKEVGGLGYEEFLYGQGISVIEWAERLGELMPKEYLAVYLGVKGEKERSVKIVAEGKPYRKILESI